MRGTQGEVSPCTLSVAVGNKSPTASSVPTVGFISQRGKNQSKESFNGTVCGWQKTALMIFVVLCGLMAASMPSGQLIGHCIQDGDGFVRVVQKLLDLRQAAAVLEL